MKKPRPSSNGPGRDADSYAEHRICITPASPSSPPAHRAWLRSAAARRRVQPISMPLLSCFNEEERE